MDNRTTQPNDVQPKPLQEDWLAGATVGDTASPSNKPKKRGLVIALIVLVVAAVVAGAAYILWPKSCFDAESYQDLVALAQNYEGGDGIDLDSVVMNSDLFTQSIYFKDGSADVNTELSDDAPDFFTKLGAYYPAHQSAAPISIGINSSYLAGTSSAVVKQRMSKVKDSLVAAGVAESSIAVHEPLVVEMDADDEGLYDDDMIDGMPVGVSIIPLSRCEQ